MIKIFLYVFIILLASCQKKTDRIENKISVESRINDKAQLLTYEEEENLFKIIQDIEEHIGSQLAVIIIDTLNGEKIEQFSLRTAQALKLGREKYKDGLLITVSVKDRELRIEVGYGLERIIKDEISAQIIKEDIIPKFKEGKFYEGLYIALDKLKKIIEINKELIGKGLD